MPGSPTWRIRASGTTQAVARLHELLLGAARFEVNRRRATLPHLRGDDFDDLAMQSADDALVAVLSKLDSYQGRQQVHHLGLQVRSARGGRQAAPAGVAGARGATRAGNVAAPPEPKARRPSRALRAASSSKSSRRRSRTSLTPHQREVLVATTLNGVPIDVLAERLNTTRGALYKTLHDARQKLRACLADRGMTIGEEGKEDT